MRNRRRQGHAAGAGVKSALLSRRTFLKLSAVASMSAVASSIPKLTRDWPNIVMFTSDTTRADRMGFNGYVRNTTPFLDRIASRGTVFLNNYSQESCTVPSTASFMTGLHPHTLGLTQFGRLQREYITLAELLRDIGYTTIASVSTPLLGIHSGTDKGFQHFSGPRMGDGTFKTNFADTVTEAVRLLESAATASQRFFLWVHSYESHVPYRNQSMFSMQGDFDDELAYVVADHKPMTGELDNRGLAFSDSIKFKGYLTERQVIQLSDCYDSQLAVADAQVARLFAYLTRRELFDWGRDCVVVNADHGELLGEHDYCPKHLGCWEEVTHTPLLIAGRGMAKSRTVTSLTSNVDIVPTLLEIVGQGNSPTPLWQQATSRHEGRSLMPVIQGAERAVRRNVLIDSNLLSAIAVRDEDGRKLVLRREVPAEALIETQKEVREDFFPSGVIRFEDVVAPGYLAFRWPSLKPIVEEKGLEAKSLWIEVDVGFALIGTYSECIRAPFSADRLNVVLPYCATENDWDATATLGGQVWRVRVKDGSGNVVFDSEEAYGKIPFALAHTGLVRELYDVYGEGGEHRNLFDDVSAESVKDRLYAECMAEYRTHTKGGEPFAMRPTVVKLGPSEESVFRSLGYL